MAYIFTVGGSGRVNNPRWFKIGSGLDCAARPFCPQEQTSSGRHGMSEKCQERTHAPQQMPSLFDHFVGELLKLQRHIEAERFGRLEIYYQLEFRRLPDRQIGGRRPPADFFVVKSGPPVMNVQIKAAATLHTRLGA